MTKIDDLQEQKILEQARSIVGQFNSKIDKNLLDFSDVNSITEYCNTLITFKGNRHAFMDWDDQRNTLLKKGLSTGNLENINAIIDECQIDVANFFSEHMISVFYGDLNSNIRFNINSMQIISNYYPAEITDKFGSKCIESLNSDMSAFSPREINIQIAESCYPKLLGIFQSQSDLGSSL